MASLEKIKAGDVLYDVHSHRMGNTTLRSMGCWSVRVIQVEESGAWVSWNGNSEQFYSRQRLKGLRTKKPVMVTDFAGRQRVARKNEIAGKEQP